MTAAPVISFQVDDLPDGLRFDGVQAVGDDNHHTWLQFTEIDEQSASYGATFYVETRSALLDAIISRREEKRIQFAAGAEKMRLENGPAR